MARKEPTIIDKQGAVNFFFLNRRDFLRTCLMAAAAVGLTGSAAARVVEAVASGKKPSVIWLHFQECTGCTMSLLRPTHPDLAELILDLVSLLSSLVWKRPLETLMLGGLSRVMAWGILGFVAVRFIDVAMRGHLGLAFALDFYSLIFLLEAGLLVAGAIGLMSKRRLGDAGALMRLAIIVAIGGSLYRLDAGLVAFMPGSNWSYFPSFIELIITLGFVAMAVMAYLYLVKRFPILPIVAADERR